MGNRKSGMPVPVLIGWCLVLGGLFLAGMVANGIDLQRCALVVPFVGLGAFICVLGEQNTLPENRWSHNLGVHLIVFVVFLYFVVRAFFSPVWDLGRYDILLVSISFLSYLSASISLKYRGGQALLLACLGILFIIHALISAIQFKWDPSFSFFRRPRMDMEGVSGAYFHRNYFAGFLALVGPFLLGLCFRIERKWIKYGCLALLLMMLAVCYLTNSRGGFLTFVVGVGCVGLFLGLRSAKKTRSKILFSIVTFLTACAFVVGGWFLFASILSKRNDVFESLEVRLQMAGVAFEIWSERPFVGQGSHAFSYLYPRHASGIYIWSGDAQMAHSEYMQILSDYGMIGLLGVSVLIVIFGWCSVVNYRLKGGNSWLALVGCAVLLAEAVRALFDFNLHIPPNLLLFSIFLGGSVIAGSEEDVESAAPKFVKRRAKLFGVALIAIMSFGLACREIASFPLWVELESLRASGSENPKITREYARRAPSFSVLREVARESSKLSASRQSEETIEQTVLDWGEVVRVHEYDGESLANYARALDDSRRFDEAEKYHLFALEAVGQRENRYGVVFGVGWHLVKRAQYCQQERRAGEALFLYENALLAFEASQRLSFSRKSYNPEMRKFVTAQIRFLTGARVKPEEVSILDWRSVLDD